MRIALYARASSDRQAEKGLSVPGQLEALRKHCLERGYTIVQEFVDDGWSGTTDQRPGFQQMIDFALTHSKELDAIFVWSYSRYSRDNLDALLYRDRLARKGVIIRSLTEPLATGPEAYLTENLLHTFNSYFPKVLARDVMRGMRAAARRGSYPLNTAPFGFARVATTEGRARRFALVPKDDEIALLKRIFREYVDEGCGAKDIANRFNEEGLRTRAGGVWSVNRVLSVLSNPIYIGTLHIRFSSANATCLASEDREIVIGNWCEPVIDAETFAAAQTCRERRARAHPRTLGSPHLLSGLLRCANCGAKLCAVSSKKGRHWYYVCRTFWSSGRSACPARMIRKDWLEHVVLERVRDVLLAEENVSNLIDSTQQELDAELPRLEEEQTNLQGQIREVRGRLERLVDVLEGQSTPPPTIWQRIQERQATLALLEERLDDLQVQIAHATDCRLDRADVLRRVAFLRENLASEPMATQRGILGSIIRQITVGDQEVMIEYALPRPATPPADLGVLNMQLAGTPGRI